MELLPLLNPRSCALLHLLDLRSWGAGESACAAPLFLGRIPGEPSGPCGGHGERDEQQVESQVEGHDCAGSLALGMDIAEPDRGHDGEREVQGVHAGFSVRQFAPDRLGHQVVTQRKEQDSNVERDDQTLQTRPARDLGSRYAMTCQTIKQLPPADEEHGNDTDRVTQIEGLDRQQQEDGGDSEEHQDCSGTERPIAARWAREASGSISRLPPGAGSDQRVAPA